METALFDFEVPEERIALRPARPRGSGRLLVIGADGGLADRRIGDLPELLRRGDLLVRNDSRVLPAALSGRKGAGRVSALLHARLGPDCWRAFVRPARRLGQGDEIAFAGGLAARVAERAGGEVRLVFNRQGRALEAALARAGEMPLPPYIARRRRADARDREDYQTSYARAPGAVAAPTAGLHFSASLFAGLRARGVGCASLTLHVGAGSFVPVRARDARRHTMSEERFSLPPRTAGAVNRARGAGGRIAALGTTSLRAIESAADCGGFVRAFSGRTSLFILPGYRFRAVDILFTNFHQPRSTLFMLAAAFAGRERLLGAYAHAVGSGYRFFSYGDACLIFSSGFGMSAFSFSIEARDGAARCGVIETAHGPIRTPAFMPVGTGASVKGVYPEQVRASGADVVLGNTYHLIQRPGVEVIEGLGGLHGFMNWPGAILTDSGGYQVMSLARLRRIEEEGVFFRSHLDGSALRLTPEGCVEAQCRLGSDIQMALDICTAHPAPRAEAQAAMERSLRWGDRALAAFRGSARRRAGQALFGIVQGGVEADLRARSARAVAAAGFDGIALGGLAVGEGQAVMLEVIEGVAPLLPSGLPRYVMGAGRPDDLVRAVGLGVDMFDCVLPTREARHGRAYVRGGVLNLRNACFRGDSRPLDEGSSCPASRAYSRAYLHHLVRSDEMLGAMLLSWNNTHYFQELMAGMRAAIREGRFAAFAAADF